MTKKPELHDAFAASNLISAEAGETLLPSDNAQNALPSPTDERNYEEYDEDASEYLPLSVSYLAANFINTLIKELNEDVVFVHETTDFSYYEESDAIAFEFCPRIFEQDEKTKSAIFDPESLENYQEIFEIFLEIENPKMHVDAQNMALSFQNRLAFFKFVSDFFLHENINYTQPGQSYMVHMPGIDEGEAVQQFNARLSSVANFARAEPEDELLQMASGIGFINKKSYQTHTHLDSTSPIAFHMAFIQRVLRQEGFDVHLPEPLRDRGNFNYQIN